MNSKPIVNHSELLSQDGSETSRPDDDGLRLLGRIIARDLLARRSAHAKKNDVKVNDTHVSADS
jgi:hypothetical protein